MRKEFVSTQYDEIYATGGAEKIYDLPYRHSGYFPLFKEVLRTVKSHGSKSVLEVGCGTGGFAHLLFDTNSSVAYRGFDFSEVAVERAIDRTKRPESFFVGDARLPDHYGGGIDTVVCTEVLEHIDSDLEVVANWPKGVFCICSVPNFDADNHVRHFSSADEVRQRYGDYIQIENVVQIKKPVLSNISWASYAKQLRWNRYRPSRLIEILGLAPFASVGGWYVFSGYRK